MKTAKSMAQNSTTKKEREYDKTVNRLFELDINPSLDTREEDYPTEEEKKILDEYLTYPCKVMYLDDLEKYLDIGNLKSTYVSIANDTGISIMKIYKYFHIELLCRINAYSVYTDNEISTIRRKYKLDKIKKKIT